MMASMMVSAVTGTGQTRTSIPASALVVTLSKSSAVAWMSAKQVGRPMDLLKAKSLSRSAY